MGLNKISQRIAELKIVPVIKLDSAEDSLPLAQALIKGGLPLAEITFRTDAAEESIRRVTKSCPEMLVGAGTITAVEQVKKAIDAGAQFIVTPGFSKAVTEYCTKNNIPIFPGACTPSEIMLLQEYDLKVAKFFPAAQFGGLSTIKALSAPFPNMKFMPTGGVSENNILEYLGFEKIIACGGSWMVPADLISQGKFDEIAAKTAAAMNLVSSK